MGTAGTILRCLGMDKMWRSCFLGAQELVHPFPTTAFPKQQKKEDRPGAGLAARLPQGLQKELRSVCREKIEWRSRPDCYLLR